MKSVPVPDVDWSMKRLELLLTSGKIAVRRARYVFLTTIIASILILTALFNTYMPWFRNVIRRPNVPPKIAAVFEELWLRQFCVVEVPVLGLQFSAYDLTIVGSIAMAILAVWYFYALRRENHVVTCICEEAKRALRHDELDKALYLYDGIAHHFLYTTAADGDTPYRREPRVGARRAVRILQFMPAWVPVAVLTSDICSLFVKLKLSVDPEKMLWTSLLPGEQIEAVLRMLVAALLVAFCVRQCLHAVRFDDATREDMNALESDVRPILDSRYIAPET